MITKELHIVMNEPLLDALPGIAYMLAEDGRLIAWNRGAEEILGYSKEELSNIYAGDLADESSKENVQTALKEALDTGRAQIEHIIIRKDGKKLPLLGTVSKISIDGEMYIIGLSMDISELYSARETIKDQIAEISKLNELLQVENQYLKDQLELTKVRNQLIGNSEALKYVLFKIKQVAATDATVLIEGETGTGKELVAKAIHNESNRKKKLFVKVNCASIPESLIESELFGHEKGAFTGAFERRIGRFELADGGTIFLDEIGELPLNVQPKLLEVLQQGEFERIGSSKTLKTNVRIIAATNKVLEDEIKKGRFRSDLFYRLNVFPISVAPLRERQEDIPVLLDYFIHFFSEKHNRPNKTITPEMKNRLIKYNWPGNIRELENMVERAVITSHTKSLNIELAVKPLNTSNDVISTLQENEINHIKKALEMTHWKISGTSGAAALLNVNPETLRSKMRKLGIKRENNNTEDDNGSVH